MSACVNVHKWSCWFLGKAQSSFSHHRGCDRHLAPAWATTCSAWQAGLCKSFALTASTSSSHKSKTTATKLGNSLRSHPDVLRCTWVTWTGEKEGCLGGPQPGICREKESCAHQEGAAPHRFELRLLDMGSVLTRFSCSISRETSKCMWAREDTETLMCFEDPKYLALKDVFVLKPWWKQSPQRVRCMRPTSSSRAWSALYLAGFSGSLPLSASAQRCYLGARVP